jgi:hypothetical protein
LNADEEPLDPLPGVVIDVSPGGVLLKSSGTLPGEDVLVSFEDVEKQTTEIRCKRAYSLKASNGIANSGLTFAGSKGDRHKFVTGIIRANFFLQKEKVTGSL